MSSQKNGARREQVGMVMNGALFCRNCVPEGSINPLLTFKGMLVLQSYWALARPAIYSYISELGMRTPLTSIADLGRETEKLHHARIYTCSLIGAGGEDRDRFHL